MSRRLVSLAGPEWVDGKCHPAASSDNFRRRPAANARGCFATPLSSAAHTGPRSRLPMGRATSTPCWKARRSAREHLYRRHRPRGARARRDAIMGFIPCWSLRRQAAVSRRLLRHRVLLSVIEHVTLPKSEVWTTRSGKEFRERSLAHQRAFAREIQRVGRQFFVQTPYAGSCRGAQLAAVRGLAAARALVPILKHRGSSGRSGPRPTGTCSIDASSRACSRMRRSATRSG